MKTRQIIGFSILGVFGGSLFALCAFGIGWVGALAIFGGVGLLVLGVILAVD